MPGARLAERALSQLAHLAAGVPLVLDFHSLQEAQGAMSWCTALQVAVVWLEPQQPCVPKLVEVRVIMHTAHAHANTRSSLLTPCASTHALAYMPDAVMQGNGRNHISTTTMCHLSHLVPCTRARRPNLTCTRSAGWRVPAACGCRQAEWPLARAPPAWPGARH